MNLLPKGWHWLQKKRFNKKIEEMRAEAAKSPSMIAWRAEPGTPEYKLYERMVNAKLLVRSTLFPHHYNLPTRWY
jgi:hypothetical protein